MKNYNTHSLKPLFLSPSFSLAFHLSILCLIFVFHCFIIFIGTQGDVSCSLQVILGLLFSLGCRLLASASVCFSFVFSLSTSPTLSFLLCFIFFSFSFSFFFLLSLSQSLSLSLPLSLCLSLATRLLSIRRIESFFFLPPIAEPYTYNFLFHS